MADWLEESYSHPYAIPEQPTQRGWMDYAKAPAARVLGLAGDASAVVRQAGEAGEGQDDQGAGEMFQALGSIGQKFFGDAENDMIDSMSDEAKQQLQATVTDPEFWRASTFALKGLNMAPDVAAAAVPAVLFPATATAAAAAVMGGVSYAGAVDDMYKITDSMSDGELRAEVPIYDEMRRNGSTEQEARREYNKVFRGMRPAIIGVLGALTGSIGVGGQVARGVAGEAATVAGEAGEGLIKRGLIGGAEGGIGGGVQAGGTDYAMQDAKVEGGLQEGYNPADTFAATAEGFALGAGMGTVAGGAFKGKEGVPDDVTSEVTNTAPVLPEAQPGVMSAPGQEATPSASGATASTQAPAPNIKLGNRATREAAARRAFENPEAVGVSRVEEVAPTGGDTAQQAALKATIPETDVTPEVTTVTPPEQTPAVTPETIPAAEPSPAAPETPLSRPTDNTPPVATAPTESVGDLPSPTPGGSTRGPDGTPLSGPRVLDDMRPEAQKVRVDQVAQQLANEKAANANEALRAGEEVARTNKRSQAVLEARQATRDAASSIVRDFAPTKGEELFYSKNAKDVTGAKRVILERARAMVDKAAELKAEIPKAFRNSSDQFNPETMILMDAQKLVNAAKGDKPPSLKLYDNFISRERDVRSGAADEAIAARRAEGDAANKVTRDGQEDAITLDTIGEDANAPADRMTPEAALLAKEALDEEAGIDTKAATNNAPDKEIPARVQQAVDDALASVGKEAKPFAVQKRVTSKGNKLVALKEKVAARKQTMAETQGHISKAREIAADYMEGKRKDAEDAATARKKVEDGIAKMKAAQAEAKSTLDRMERARQETNTKPTPAQIESGNYAKGKVSIQGHEIALETPKGAERKGVSPEGKPWSVKMNHDYGYLRRTEGADGEHIDVLVGPDHDAKYHYVVDQVDLGSRQFDEHKVLMGFPNETAAVRAYDRMFSDGRGVERVGNITKMTDKEFREWKSKPQSEPLSDPQIDFEARSEARMSDMDLDIERYRTGKTPEGYAFDPISRRYVQPERTLKGEDALKTIDITHLSGVPRAMAGIIRNHLSKLVGNVEVHFVTPEQMRYLGEYDGDNTPLGYHVVQGRNEAVFVRADLVNHPETLTHTVMHELVHAATVKAVETDVTTKGNIRSLIDSIGEVVPFLEEEDAHALSYGLSNEREFIAEAMSNPDFQAALSKIPATPEMVERLGMDRGTVRTMWDALVKSVRRILKMPDGAHSMLDAAIRVSERAFNPAERAGDTRGMISQLADGRNELFKRVVKRQLDGIRDRKQYAPTGETPHLLGLHTFDYIARTADRFFPVNNPVRRVSNAIEGMRTAAKRHVDAAAPIVDKLRGLEQKYKGQQWEDFTTLLHEETMNGVFADRPLDQQKHISKSGSRDAWMRDAHKDLSARHDAMPADLKAARKEALDYFTARRNEMSLKTIRNRIVTLFDTADPDGLAQRIHDGSVTDADKTLLGDMYDTIKEAGTLSKVDGPYFPLMRRGNFVVKATMDVSKPANAKELAPNQFEFTDKDAAEAFMTKVAKETGRPVMNTVYVDAAGETHGVTSEGKTARYTANDFGTHPVYRVSVQDRHVEMFDTLKDARNRVAELRKAGVKTDDAVPRQYEGYGVQLDALSVQMRKMISGMEQRAEARGLTAEQVAELRQSLGEASLQMLGSTRISARSINRKYVAGASKDVVRNTLDYAHAAGNQIAKLDYRPEVDKALADMNQYIKDNAADGNSAGRQAIANQVMKRVTTPNPIAESKGGNALINRILAMSFMDKLASPSYSMVNATQPMMTTTPYLAGNYGIGRAVSAMAKAYSDVGSLKVITQGIRDTGGKIKGAIQATDPASMIMSRLTNPQEKGMLQILMDRGVIDADSGLEVDSALKRSNTPGLKQFDTTLGYLEGITRQMPKTVEAINRTVSALATYRLEMARSGDHARAVQAAHDAVNRTQFNYSMDNAAPWMKHPAARLAFQFKKYGLGMYQLLGEQVGIAYRNAEPGDRARAIKSLSYTMAMHGLVAGALGLPTEPLKLTVLAANGLGLTDWTWGDVESAERDMAADMFGKDFGEIVSRGVPRAFGIDLSSRMGLDTLMGPFGEPRSNEAADWKAYAWDNLSGAPAGLVADWGKGINSLAAGDFGDAAQRLIPLKVAADAIKAYRTASEGTVSQRTGKQVMSPYSVGEAVSKTLGFAPAREAESFERSGTYYRRAQALEDKRKSFQMEWAQANGASKGRVWREVVKWNRTVSPEARLTIKDLRGYQKRVESDMRTTQEGIRAKRRETSVLNRANQTYDYQK